MTTTPLALPSWASPSRLAAESGVTAILTSPRDTKILCLQRFVRLFAYGASFLILVHFLSSLGFSDERIGLFMTLTLLGDVVVSVVLTAVTDQVGRRKVLAAGALLMTLSGLVFSFVDSYWLLVLASIVGVISPSGAEIGPFRAVEESILAHLTDKEVRSDIFAWYTLFGSAGTALGTVLSGWLVQALEGIDGWDKTRAYRVVFLVYAGLGLVKFSLMLGLTSAVEAEALQQPKYQRVATEMEDEGSEPSDVEPDFDDHHRDDGRQPHDHPTATTTTTRSSTTAYRPPIPKLTVSQRFRALLPHISAASRPILYRLLFLFFLDAFASGMASPSWLTYFFTTMHSLAPGTLGTLFFVANLLATISNLLALPLARRFGPLKTMVFAHLPSTVFLAMIPLPPSSSRLGTPLAMMLLALRACTQTIDQAPRQAFISAVVLPGERTALLGVLNTAKTLAQAGGTGIAGVLAGRQLWVAVLSGAGVMKAAYDLLMLWMFLGVKERDEEIDTSTSRDEEER